jgi:2-dehydro-3-deoxygluconokinase
MSGLVTLGELLGQVATEREGVPPSGAPATLSVCAEATVAIGVRRLGVPAAYMGRTGDDAFGRMGRDVLRSEGVDVSRLTLDPSAPTGLRLRIRRTADRTLVEYLRSRSAGSRLSPEDVDPDLVWDADLLHVTGITPALSDTAAAVDRACDLARRSGGPISFDVNHREQLWGARSARAALLPLATRADILFGGRHELALLLGAPPDSSPGRLLTELVAQGPSEVVVSLGAEGAVSLCDGEFVTAAAHRVTPVDVIGTGDAFVAGYLAGRIEGLGQLARLQLASTLGAFAVSTRGDWEGLPGRTELALLKHTTRSSDRQE